MTLFWSTVWKRRWGRWSWLDEVPYLYRQPLSVQSLLSVPSHGLQKPNCSLLAFHLLLLTVPSLFLTGSSPKYWWMLMYFDTIHFSVGSRCIQSFLKPSRIGSSHWFKSQLKINMTVNFIATDFIFKLKKILIVKIFIRVIITDLNKAKNWKDYKQNS